jgi:kynurenine formamidase
LYTGYSKYWPDKVKYLGTENRGEEAVKDLHFPGLDPEAAKWLIENRRLKAIGLDTASIDYGQSQLFESHVTLFKESVPAFENVANLDKLPAKGAIVFALPMKIKGASGGPLRIVALIPHNDQIGGMGYYLSAVFLSGFGFMFIILHDFKIRNNVLNDSFPVLSIGI